MFKNKLSLLALVLTAFLPVGFGASVIQDTFIKFGTTISTLILNEKVVLGFMFFAMIVGTFALFKGLLRFSFGKVDGSGQFGQKEINVIALMLSIIGTTGIFFIFRTDASGLISLFGGSVGLLFVLFICVLIMRFFIDFAKSFENTDGPLGKGAGWISIVALGAICSLFLIIGYAGQVLKSLGCKVTGAAKNVSCTSLSDYNIFLVIYNNGSAILTWLIFFGVIFGLMALKKKPDEVEQVKSDSSSDNGFLGNLFSGGKKKTGKKKTEGELSPEIKKNVKKMQGHLSRMGPGLKNVKDSVNKQHDILTEISNELKRGGGL